MINLNQFSTQLVFCDISEIKVETMLSSVCWSKTSRVSHVLNVNWHVEDIGQNLQ